MAEVSSTSSPAEGRGHLIVRSHPPLPSFVCVVPVPPHDSTVSQLRSTVVAILSGQTNAATQAAERRGSNAPGSKIESQPLSYSEHLKQQTVQDWRLQSVVLELNQNAYIAPETRSKLDEGNHDRSNNAYEPGNGFVLLDSHEGALLEHGDEINVVLREGQTIESLHLPLLSSKHVFGLPNQPRLSRNGTIIARPDLNGGGLKGDYVVVSEREMPPILKPSEPSSHSSSVSANPDVNYETTMRHRSAPAGWHRVLVLDSSGTVQKKTEEPKHQPQLSSAIKDGKRTKPRRLLSEGSNAVLVQGTKPGPPMRQQSANFSSAAYTEAIRPVLVGSPMVETPPYSPPPLSSPSLSNRDIIAAQGTTNVASKAERQQHEKVRKAGQRSLPAQALVIGHGVQGKVGRIQSTDGRRTASNEKTETTGQTDGHGEYGNMDAFVSFTAASSEVHQTRPTNGVGTRRMSSRSATSGPERTTSSRIASNTTITKPGLATSPHLNTESNSDAISKGKSRESKNKYVKVPERPQLPPIQNLAPFSHDPTQETLMPMPTASPVQSSEPSASSSPQIPHTPMTQLELQMANDAAIAQALSESLDVVQDAQGWSDVNSAVADGHANTKMTSTNGRTQDTSSSPLLSRMDSSTSSSPAITRRSSNSPQLSRDNDENAFQSGGTSKADRRYNEVKKALQAEKDRQAENHRIRLEKARRASEEKMETIRKAETERRQREEKIRWQMWQDVRSRQTKE